MRLRPRSIAVLTCAAAIGCGGGDSSGGPTMPTSAVTIHLGGRVVDERMRQGVPGMTLFWGGGRAGLQQITSTTDATGAYQVDLPEQESYSVSTSGNPRVYGTVRPTGPIDIINLLVNTGGCPTLYGRIVDAVTRRPVTGATVTWVGLTSTSDAAGNYRLGLECRPGAFGSGETTLGVTHPAYQAYSSRSPQAETLGLSASDERMDLALTPR